MKASPIRRKHPLTTSDLYRIVSSFDKLTHNDKLFLAIITTGFFSLLRLGELTDSDNYELRDPRKRISRSSVVIKDCQYSFRLPYHKADRFFEGNSIIICENESIYNPKALFEQYLSERDHRFPFHTPLFITSKGSVPTRSFFMSRLRIFCSTEYAGHSMRSGGATFLAERGVAPHLIQAIGRWSSDAWQVYVRKNPILINALIESRGVLGA